MQEPTHPKFGEGRRRGISNRAIWSLGPAGGVATACRHRGPDATREAPAGDRGGNHLEARESQAGPCGVAERSVVPTKPSNSGGGKGPQLKTDATSNKGHGD